MKILFLMAGLLALLSCKENQKENPSTSSVSRDSAVVKKDPLQAISSDPIDQIKKEYTALQDQMNAKKFSTSKFTYDCNGEPTGEVVFHSDKDNVKIIEHFYAEHSHFSAVERYFIKEGKPFFIFTEETVWNFDGGTPEKPVTKDDITETRTYLQDGQPLKCLEKKYSIRSNHKTKSSRDQFANKEVPCHADQLLKAYETLLKHKDQKGAVRCL
ncbi:hypothetical protein [Chryseobacterium pennipullorum]|uniref:Lipoprotein n=1 Tax=Chryseobacterium pennipullorum TaxID=2258963 RepID=A0A3D9AXW1_9FLAO|nr:hypothetical protein [Chryseobacterium pennipullorum]REC46188.1 hypothetical protein DRF67_15675 [Chryseobacterium pennipullorum]